MKKVNINFTIATIEDDIIIMTINRLYELITDSLHYIVLNLVYGKHRDASTMHSHIHFSVEIPNIYKTYKYLNEKIKRNEIFSLLKSEIKEKLSYKIAKTNNSNNTISKNIEIKISFKYSDEIDYDEFKSLAYPLKEYDTKDNMVIDLCNIELEIKDKLVCLQENDDWEVYREYANKIYIVSKKIKRDKKEIKDKKDEEERSLQDYLEKNIKQGDGELLDEIETRLLIHHTVRHSLFWYRQHDKKFNVNSLKNIAINFLYKRQNIDENNILIYLKL